MHGPKKKKEKESPNPNVSLKNSKEDKNIFFSISY